MARDTEYAFAVSSVRVREKELLTGATLEQLLAAADYEEARQILVDRGWLPADGDDEEAASERLADAWDFLRGIAPEPEMLQSLVLRYDFHNLKAAVKCRFNDQDPAAYFIRPCAQDPDEVAALVADGKFESLPAAMRDGAREAYDVFVRTQDGQYAEVYIDAAALRAIRAAGRRAKCALVDQAAELTCAAANIKTALRAAATGKDAHFLERALTDCDTVAKSELASAALKGQDAVLAYLERTDYAAAVMAMKEAGSEAMSAFEKWFDDAAMDNARKGKLVSFGPEPLAAYFLACEAELRNVRILLSAKKHGMKESVIRERMRRLYG